MNLEKIILDLKGISVFGHKGEIVSHIKDVFEYPQEGIKDKAFFSHISQEWSSDDLNPGGGGGDWYESERKTQSYIFVEKIPGGFREISYGPYIDRSAIVDDLKGMIEDNGHKIAYVIKRLKVDGPNWGYFDDIVYVAHNG